MPAAVPDHMPTLSPGAHRRPDQGACLMEYVSLLAGYSFSDAPPCTHPLVAQVARVTNDVTSRAVRDGLVRMAPDLAAAAGTDPRVRSALVLCAARTALHAAPPGALWPRRVHRLRACARSARERLDWPDRARGGPRPWWQGADLKYRYVAARGFRDALDALVHLPQAERDAALVRLLGDALAICSTYAGSAGAESVRAGPGLPALV